MKTLKGQVSGKVQGVGFRYFVKTLADQYKLNGFVQNLANGQVGFCLQGESQAVEAALGLIQRGPRFSRVDDVKLISSEIESQWSGFEILRD